MKKIYTFIFFFIGQIIFSDSIFVQSLSNTSYINLSTNSAFKTDWKTNFLSQSDVLLKKMTPLAPAHKQEIFSDYLNNFNENDKKNFNSKEIHEKYYNMKRLYRLIDEDRYLKTMSLK